MSLLRNGGAFNDDALVGRSPELPAREEKAHLMRVATWLRHPCVAMILVALFVRLVAVWFLLPERLNPDRDYWRFAGETGRIAASLVRGQGYANPLFGETGPTAWMPPVYPFLLAATFKLFGIYTKASAAAILTLNCLFSALTCLPVFFIARRGFGERAAFWAGWSWALFPYAVFFAADFIWPTTLTTLFLALLIWFALLLEDCRHWRFDLAFGAFAGVAALNDPIVLAVTPFLAAWMLLRCSPGSRRKLAAASVMGLGLVLTVAPWFVRNYVTFHTFVPFRDILGLELHVGNNGDDSHFAPQGYHPSASSREFEEYRTLGELAYMERKREEAMSFIRSHPLWFAGVTARRILYMWTSFWSFDPAYQEQEPFDLPNILLSTLVDVVALAGLYRAFRQRSDLAVPFGLVLLFFPMVYYFTHWEDYYRRPLDPVFVMLAAYELVSRFSHAREQVAATKSRAGDVTPSSELVTG